MKCETAKCPINHLGCTKIQLKTIFQPHTDLKEKESLTIMQRKVWNERGNFIQRHTELLGYEEAHDRQADTHTHTHTHACTHIHKTKQKLGDPLIVYQSHWLCQVLIVDHSSYIIPRVLPALINAQCHCCVASLLSAHKTY